MRTRIFTLACAFCIAAGVGAQTAYDAANIAQRDLNGTARFVGMGGAMSALGGDISTIGTNPAGIGIYRSNDVMLSFGYSAMGTESNYGGIKSTNDKNRWSFDNIGAVISTKIGNVTPLRYVNFGFNYHRSKSFYKNMSMEGLMGSVQMADGRWAPISQVRYMAQQGTDTYWKDLDYTTSDPYYDINTGWLGVMGYQGFLTDLDGSVFRPYVPTEAYGYFHSQERGGIDQYDINISFNVNDRFYLGLTAGIYDVDYSKYALYDESYDTQEGYSMETFSGIRGAGFNVKLGAIVRPFEYSPLRIGLAVHTPTFYNLTYTTGALLTSDRLLPDAQNQTSLQRSTVDTYELLGGRDMERDFQLNTPWVVNASLGYTVGNSLALGAEYEFENYGSMKFSYPEGGEMSDETSEVGRCLKAVHTVRVGAEYRPIPAFAFRAGYNHSTAAFEDDALKYLPANSISTDTDYANTQSMNTFTLGIGYRWSSFYVDLAYKYQNQKADFYPFFNELSDDASQDYVITSADQNVTLVTPEATKVKYTRSQVLLTLGFRF